MQNTQVHKKMDDEFKVAMNTPAQTPKLAPTPKPFASAGPRDKENLTSANRVQPCLEEKRVFSSKKPEVGVSVSRTPQTSTPATTSRPVASLQSTRITPKAWSSAKMSGQHDNRLEKAQLDQKAKRAVTFNMRRLSSEEIDTF